MTQMGAFGHPLMLGFEDVERALERLGKSGGDGYPPYNIERLPGSERAEIRLRITVAVAGFGADDLDMALEGNKLSIRGRQSDDGEERQFLHRGIAARQFHRGFVLAAGVRIESATLRNGLLAVDMEWPQPENEVQKISIRNLDEPS